MRDELAARRDAMLASKGFEDAHSAVDSAIGSNAALLSCLLDVRTRHMSGMAGQMVVEGMIHGLRGLAKVRQHLINVHTSAGDLGREFGLPVAEGGLYPKPPTGIEVQQAQAA